MREKRGVLTEGSSPLSTGLSMGKTDRAMFSLTQRCLEAASKPMTVFGFILNDYGCKKGFFKNFFIFYSELAFSFSVDLSLVCKTTKMTNVS